MGEKPQRKFLFWVNTWMYLTSSGEQWHDHQSWVGSTGQHTARGPWLHL